VTSTAAARSGKDVAADLAFLTRALKAPALRDSAARLAERARDEAWSHEEYLVACLQREVAARDAHGGEGRIRAARFPGRKTLEEFDFDHARGLKRDLILHLGTLDGSCSPPPPNGSTGSPRPTTPAASRPNSSAHPVSVADRR
jgi:DNA replication protein DnaC